MDRRFGNTLLNLRALLVVLLLSSSAFASLTSVYVAQNATGSGDGSNCSNAKDASFFNTAGNWGSGSSQIGAGTTVHLCGTWTGPAGSTLLTFQGSGATGNVITLLFEPGAIMQAPYFANRGGAIFLNGKSHILIDGGATCGALNGSLSPIAVSSCNGTIKNTNNGTQQTYQQNSNLIYGGQGLTFSDVEIRNLVLSTYQRVDPHSQSGPADGANAFAIYLDHVHATGINIHHNNIQHDSEAVVVDFEGSSISNVIYANNYVADMHWGLVLVGATPGTTGTNIQIHDNIITDWHNWLSPTSTFHQNGIMVYNGCGTANGCSIGDSTSNIYNNYLCCDLSGNSILSSPSGLISLQDNAVNFNVFNNVAVQTTCVNGGSCAGDIYFLTGTGSTPGGGGMYVYNNTIYGASTDCTYMQTTTANTLRNNIFGGTCTGIVIPQNDPSQAVADHDIGFNTNSWFCYNTQSSGICKTLPLYQGNPYFQEPKGSSSDPKLDTTTWQLQSGSAAIGAAVNLFSVCNGQPNPGLGAMCFDKNGVARPSTGAWDAGAYQFGSDPAPQGLALVVN
jgi:hypothetical protein